MSPRRRTRPIRDDTARLDPATTRLPPPEPATDPFPVVRLDVPDERTPLYDALYAIHGLGGRHHLNPDRRAPVGRHYDENGNGIADGAELPHDDGREPDPYTVVHPDEFEDGD